MQKKQGQIDGQFHQLRDSNDVLAKETKIEVSLSPKTI